MERILIPRNSLVMLVGPAGCGKSTFAAKHFLPTQVVSSDECRARICDDPTDQRITPFAFDLMHTIIEMRLQCGRLTVADATNLKSEDRRPMMRLARRFGFHASAIVFDTPLQACLARNAGRQRRVPIEAIRLQFDLLRKTMATMAREPFAQVWILDDAAASQAVVQVGRWSRQGLSSPPRR